MQAFELRCVKFFFDAFLPPVSESDDYYEILGVDRRATSDEIRRAYRQRAVRCHPDKKLQRGSSVGDAQDFKRLKEAYEVGLIRTISISAKYMKLNSALTFLASFHP